MKRITLLLTLLWPVALSCAAVPQYAYVQGAKKADVNTPDNIVALFNAVNEGDSDTVDVLLKLGVYPDVTDGNGSTILTLAVYSDNFTIARALLEHGANPLKHNVYGDNPLSLAGKWCKIKMIKLMMQYVGGQDEQAR